MRANYHTHTTRCGHATGSEREYVERAIAAGLDTLGFSDHAPMPFDGDYYSSFRMKIEETEAYVNTLLSLRDEYKNDIRILIGFEAEYYPAYFQRFLDLIAPYPIDYLILGQHFIDNEIGAQYSGRPTEEEAHLQRYVDQTIEAMKTGRFTYFAHPDLLNFTGDAQTYRRHILRLCQAAKALDVPLEINMLGLFGSRHYPSERFFRVAGEVGNKAVVGIDAHQAERILEKDVLEKARALAEKCGLAIAEDIRLRPVRE